MRSVRLNRVFRRDPVGAQVSPMTIVGSATVGWWRSDLMCSGALWENQKSLGGGTGWTAVGAAQPTYSASDAAFNNRPSLLWDGVDDEMATTIAAPAPGTTNRFYWIVADNIAFTAGTGTLISGVAGAAHIIYRDGIDAANQLTLFNTLKLQGAANFTVGTARLVQAGLTNTGNDFIKIGGSAPATGINAGNSSAASMRLGSFGGGGFANVRIAEILIANRIPNATERAALEAYAVGLYGASVTA